MEKKQFPNFCKLYKYFYLFMSWPSGFFQRESKKPSMGKEYFNHMNLEGIVRNYPYRKNLPEEDLLKG